MPYFARIHNGIVAEPIINVETSPGDFAGDTWVEVPENLVNLVKEQWQFSNNSFSAPAVVLPTKSELLASLIVLSQSKQNLGINFTPAGASSSSLFSADVSNRVNLVSAYLMAKDGLWVDGTFWKDANGNFIALTLIDVQNLAKGLAAYIVQCVEREAVLAQTINNYIGEHPDTDITQGWPSNG